jgi:hypothetical protein
MKLAEIASRIQAHLKRFEADPVINKVPAGRMTHPYYLVNVWAAGAYVQIRYVGFQGNYSLRKQEAKEYLDWLDTGNVGKHFSMQRPKE